MKQRVDASRPNGRGNDAFPSRHAATAFSAAAYVHYRYGWQWGLPFEAAAAAVGYSRVKLNEHRWRDVIGGAVLAHAAAFLAVDAKNDSDIVIPIIGGKKNEFGLLVKVGF